MEQKKTMRVSPVLLEAIKKEMGFPNDAISKKTDDCIIKWVQEWNLSQELILLAHDITVKNIGHCSIPYTDKILFNWHSQNITTLEQAKQLQEEFQKNKKNAPNISGYAGRRKNSPPGNLLKSADIAAQFSLAGKLYASMYEIYGNTLAERLDEIVEANRNYAQCAGFCAGEVKKRD